MIWQVICLKCTFVFLKENIRGHALSGLVDIYFRIKYVVSRKLLNNLYSYISNSRYYLKLEENI